MNRAGKQLLVEKLREVLKLVEDIIEVFVDAPHPRGARVRILKDTVELSDGMESDVGKIGFVQFWDGYQYAVDVVQRKGTPNESTIRLHYFPDEIERLEESLN